MEVLPPIQVGTELTIVQDGGPIHCSGTTLADTFRFLGINQLLDRSHNSDTANSGPLARDGHLECYPTEREPLAIASVTP